jgi:uncharacterized coiled-coil protein SlyX
MKGFVWRLILSIYFLLISSMRVWGIPQSVSNPDTSVAEMKEQIARQNAHIQQLEEMMARQQLLLEKLQERFAVLAPVLAAAPPAKSPEPVVSAKPGEASSSPPETGRGIGGVQVSGDFRLRFDLIARSGNAAAPPVQNARARYRFHLNLDWALDPRFRVHAQLSSGPMNNWLTDNQDFAGMVAKHPISLSEAYAEFRPNKRFAVRGGKTEEVFADSTRFLWDDDIRFNGFNEIWNTPLSSNRLHLTSVEFRAGQYLLSNPNVAVLPEGSPITGIGIPVGSKVRSANLFHQGIVLKGDLGSSWGHQLISDFQIYRNPDQIQLATVASGLPSLVGAALGVTLSGPPPGLGNATKTAAGVRYYAPGFQIARLAYRVEAKAFRLGERIMPLWFDVQASRNTGTSSLRDAVMGTVNVGAIKQRGDVRFLYQYAIKDANALISAFADDDLGPATGVNIASHGIRFDLGLTRFLQWQSLLFIENQRRPSNPAQQFFVPLPRGANPTYRFISQILFTF